MFLFLACLSFTVAGTPEHQCLLCLCFCLLAQRHSGASPAVATTTVAATTAGAVAASAATIAGAGAAVPTSRSLSQLQGLWVYSRSSNHTWRPVFISIVILSIYLECLIDLISLIDLNILD